jgi:hypothetical protein
MQVIRFWKTANRMKSLWVTTSDSRTQALFPTYCSLWLGAFLAFLIFMRGEVRLLLGEQSFRLLAQIITGFDGFLTRFIEG